LTASDKENVRLRKSITVENIRKITKFAMLNFIADWNTEKKLTKVTMLKLAL
jgi:hypothetical protein